MSVVETILYVMIIVVALLLIGLILIQPSKSGGMGAAFGGIGESVFGGKAGSHLTKATVVMTTLFFVLALALAALVGRGYWKTHGDLGDRIKAQQVVKDTPQSAAQPAAQPAKQEGQSGKK